LNYINSYSVVEEEKSNMTQEWLLAWYHIWFYWAFKPNRKCSSYRKISSLCVYIPYFI